MKKLLGIILLLLCAQTVLADEGIPTQDIEVEKSGAVIVFQKQPATEVQKQTIKIKKCGALLFIQINGKVKNTDIGNG